MMTGVTLFLSHASEDKDFIRQLDARLKAEGFETWVDEQKINLGDSILGKINEGLLVCDYGVVVLSPTFFGKKWTRTELGALMALETTTKKMILPIWRGLSAAEITELMPTLADRLAVNAAQGLDVVVQAIKSAVNGAEHQRKLSRMDQLKARLEKMSATSKARYAADKLLNSSEGSRKVRAEGTRFGELLANTFTDLSTDHLKFTAKQSFRDHYNIDGPNRYGIEVHFSEGASNVAAFAELHCTFYRLGAQKVFGEREEPRLLATLKFYPYFDTTGAVVWSPTEKREETMSTEDVIAELAEKLTDYVTREVR